MPKVRTVRSTIAVILAMIAALAALLMFLPMRTFPLWLCHYAALEGSLLTSFVAAVALLLAIGVSKMESRIVVSLALPALFAGLSPAAAVAPLYWRAGRGFSLSQYFGEVGARSEPNQSDVRLDATLPGLTADVYRGFGEGPRPFVVVVHGGSWQGGDKGEVKRTSRALSAAGITSVDVQYRLSPQVRFPVAVGDVKCWLGRLRERAAEFGIDPHRAALLGRSAGGEIALIAAYSAGDARVPPSCATTDEPVQAVVGLYAPTDLAWGYEHPSRPDVVHGPAALRAYMGGTPAERVEGYRLGTPETWVDGRTLPRTLLIHGTLDRLVSVEHAERLARSLVARGASPQLLEIPLAEHGFDARPGGLGEQLARSVILSFLGKL